MKEWQQTKPPLLWDQRTYTDANTKWKGWRAILSLTLLPLNQHHFSIQTLLVSRAKHSWGHWGVDKFLAGETIKDTPSRAYESLVPRLRHNIQDLPLIMQWSARFWFKDRSCQVSTNQTRQIGGQKGHVMWIPTKANQQEAWWCNALQWKDAMGGPT